MSRFVKLFAVLMVLTLAVACDKKSDSTSDETIKAWVLAHPEILIQSLQSYQHRSNADADKVAAKALSTRHDDIFNNPHSPVFGNPDGKTQIVEFFDYNCGYCKRMLPDLQRTVSENKDIKIIFKEVAILSPSSETMALAALVVYDVWPDKYFAFHSELMKSSGIKSEADVKAAADRAGLNGAKIIAKMKDAKYKAMLDKNVDLAHALSIQGTPTFIIGSQIVRGAVGYAGLKDIIAGKGPKPSQAE